MITKLKETQDNVLDTIKSRFADPIIGGYMVSFIFVNWKIFLYFFSNMEVETKIIKINGLLYPSIFGGIDFLLNFVRHPLILPFIIAYTYHVIYPVIFRRVLKTISENQVKLENDRYDTRSQLIPMTLRITQLESQTAAERERIFLLEKIIKEKDERINFLNQR